MSDTRPGSPDDPPSDGPDAAPRVRPVLGGRSSARERALHLLYEASLTDRTGPQVLADQVLAADRYAEDLVTGVDAHREELLELLRELSPPGWTPQRMATLDRTVLLMACYELAHRPEVPTGVILSEAVGLAETYGTDESPRFVNGLLAAAARRVRSQPAGDVEPVDDPAEGRN